MFHELIVDLEDFTIKKKLGEGTFGSVYLVEEKETGQEFAAKVSKFECLKASDQKAFFQEISALSIIKNAATLKIKGFNLANFENEHFPTILTQYMPNGSLEKLIKENKNLDPTKKYIILLGIAEGMKYLHFHKIIHRDLKPANVLLDKNQFPHIADFGGAFISQLAISSIQMDTYIGTPIYMAPEVFSDEKYTYKSDIYSYSILAYEVITGENPFPGYTSIF